MKKIYNYRQIAVLFTFVLSFIGNHSNAQTTIISPTGDGGFETGTTFAANSWITDSPGGTTNQWVCSTGATAGFSGTRCAYVSNTSTSVPPTHTYTINVARSSHIWRNVTVPAGQTSISLNFNWIGLGETTYDRMRIWLVPTSVTPTNGNAIAASGTAPTGNIQAGLTNYSSQSTWTSASVAIPAAYAGTTFRLVVEWTNDNTVGTSPPAAIDNISLTSTSCISPSTLSSSNITSSSATISWTAASPAPASGYEYYVSTSATPPLPGTTPTGATAAGVLNANLSGLMANTNYYFWVRSNCNGVDKGAWFGSSTFFTGYCVSTSTATGYFINNFSTSGAVSNITNNGSGLSTGGYGNFTGLSASQYAGQPVNFSAAYTGGTFGFAIWIDWNDDLDFVDAGESVYVSGSYNAANTGSFTVPAGASVGNHRMRIRADYNATSPVACGTITNGETEDYILNVVSPPACASFPSALASSAITFTTATISWAAASPAPANGYEYYISTSATTPSAGTTPTGNTAAGVLTANLTGLTANTTYYFWVRSVCNGIDKGLWAGFGTFFTGYCSATSTNTTYYINNFSTTAAISNITNNASGFSSGGYGNFTGLSASQYPGQPINFSAAYTGGTFGFAIWIDWNDDLDFADAGETVYISGAYNASNTGSFTVPVGASAGNHRMRIRADYNAINPLACGTISSGETEDYTFKVIALACTSTPSNLIVTGLSSTTATISWTAGSPAPANGYEYYLSTSATTPAVGAIATGTTVAGVTTVSLTGLAPNTTYYVWVRSNCNGIDKGVWVPGTFYTGYCLSTSTSAYYYITNFSTSGGFSNITNLASGYSTGGYGNFTAQSVSQVAGGNINFNSAYYDGTFYFYGFTIWVDWNNDLDFNDPGETVYAPGTSAVGHSGNFTIPAAAAAGNYRMRIRADLNSLNPTACGSISSGETEDYTLTVTTPLPCGSNPSNVVANITTATTATLSWSPAPSTPSNGYQYYYSTSSTAPGTSTFSGSTTSAVVSANLTGLTAGVTYYAWVRSNCGGALGQGVWIGPISFFIPTCGIGNSMGTTTLACPSVIAGGLGLSGADPATIDCTSSGCVNLEATYTPIASPTSYTVQSIPYSPPYQFNCLKNPVSVNNDDVWSPLITLPFNFCFYGNSYNKCLISSNGAITFDTTTYAPGGFSNWSFSNSVPSPNLFKNAIFGVYQDIDPSISGAIGYELITLNTGCRALVASWNNIPMFSASCNSLFYTGMIVLYENTNVIDVYIKEKNVCASWNGGNAIVGLQNANGTAGIAAPNRNGLDTDWTASNEAWRFTPSGASTTTIKWYQGAGTAGPVVGTSNTLNVCPTATTTYTAEITYNLCSGRTLVETDQTLVTVNKGKTWNGSVSTNWNTAANWTPAGVPSAINCVTIPTVANPCNITGSGFDAFAYNVTVQNGGILQVNPSNNITVTDVVNVNTGGQFLIKDTASLIQVNNVPNVGTVNMERITQPMYRYDYTYWGSPMTFASNFTLGTLSPATQPDKYYSWKPTQAGSFGTWQQESIATVMNSQKGYIARAPQTYSTNIGVKVPYTGNFIGTPNNGDISCPILFGTMGPSTNNDKYNLLGNPYPSAVSAASFLNLPANANVIDGTIYFWTHNSPPSTVYPDPFYNDFITNYSAQDYASWNKMGGVGTMALSGGSTPNGFIAAGQAFFVRSLAVAGNALFKNNMRVSNNNNQFFRHANTDYLANVDDDNFEKHRIWLNLTNNTGAFSQILVGYAAGATQGWDRGYDGIRFNDSNNITFYSIIPGNILVIQGRMLPFDVTDQVPLGYVSTLNGSFSIRLDHFDGLFESQNVYLEDRTLGVIHNLKEAPYTFTTEIGTFNDRFVLRYDNGFELGTYSPETKGTSAFIYDKKFFAAALHDMKSIEIYEVNGKLIETYTPSTSDARRFSADFIFAKGVYFAKIRLDNGLLVTQKLINR